MMHSSCLLALLLTISVQGMEVVARVRFAQTHYVVMEQGPSICIEVINEFSPTSVTVSYSFSTSLTGIGDGLASTRSGILQFGANSTTSQLCFPHTDDDIPCEANITGTVRLNNNSAVAIGEPASALVTIQDDDYIYATFDEEAYELQEGEISNENPVISVTHDTWLKITKVPSNGRVAALNPSLSFTPILLQLSRGQNSLPISIDNDDIALEDLESIVLQLETSSRTLCSTSVKLGPQNKTTILLYDKDIVNVELTTSEATVREGEKQVICVTLSKLIARELKLLLHIRDGTANLADLNTTSETIPMTFMPRYDLTKCIEITAVQDNVIESEEFFMIELSVATVLPANIQNNLKIGRSSTVISIQDTSICTPITLDPANVNSTVYVHNSRTLCFTCKMCSSQILWNLTSYKGHIWSGRTGQYLESESNLQPSGEVFPNGTLLLTNSSSVFSSSTVGVLRFSEDSQQASEFSVYVGVGARITELRMTTLNENVRFTCKYSGSPQPQIIWLANSEQVKDEDIVDMKGENTFESILVIHRTMSELNLQCLVSNSFGSDSAENRIERGGNTLPISASTTNFLHFSLYLWIVISTILAL